MPSELETARRIVAGELAHMLESDIALSDVLPVLETEYRRDLPKSATETDLRMFERLAVELKSAAEMFDLVGKRDLARTVNPAAAKYRRLARAELRKWKPPFPYATKPTLEFDSA